MALAETLAAGGIVVRGGPRPLIAISQLRKCGSWVLPKGKLNEGESFLAAAKREVLEETGCHVMVHDFLGTLSYEVGSKTKIVQFWCMRPTARRSRELMRDVRAVAWLPLPEAIDRLTRPYEKVFLSHVGPKAVAKARAATVVRRRKTESPAESFSAPQISEGLAFDNDTKSDQLNREGIAARIDSPPLTPESEPLLQAMATSATPADDKPTDETPAGFLQRARCWLQHAARSWF